MKTVDTVKIAMQVLPSFKKVGGPFITDEKMLQLMTTLEALSNLDRFATTVTTMSGTFSIQDYKVDATLAKIAKPRAVTLPGSPFLTINLRKQEDTDAKLILTPASFVEAQFELLSKFKRQPNFQPVADIIKDVDVSNLEGISDGKRVHCDGLEVSTKLPIELVITDEAFKPEYFETDLSIYVQAVFTNLGMSLSQKQ